MESTLVAEFVKKTACETPDIAYHYLQSGNWDVELAVQAFRDAVNGDFAETTRKLARGISRATDNVNIVSKVRSDLARNFENSSYLEIDNYVMEIPMYTFMLPDLNAYGEEFQNFLEKDLIEISALNSLEQAGRLNWWCNELGPTSKLWPLATTGDGNCLLHAASLSMWGFHDRLLILRKALHLFLKGSCSIPLKRRWRWQVTKLNAQAGFCYAEDEWDHEWQLVVDLASPEKRSDNQQGKYESLEEVHILALAHILRRPIIVISDTMLRDSNNEPFAPIPFGGIYLPFDCDHSSCHKIPLFLTYDMAHFSALVCMEKDINKGKSISALTPLVDKEGALLPVQFSVDPGTHFSWANFNANDAYMIGNNEKDQISFLKCYLDIIDLSAGNNSDVDSEEEIEKRFAESLDITDGEQNNIFNNKNKAAKQLQTLGKQFGSIGKSMSKKLKKNFGSLTKLAKTKKSENTRSRMLCAEVQLRRDSTQSEMIKNYLKYAHQKFLIHHINNFPTKCTEDFLLKAQAIKEGPIPCINQGCEFYGTVFTSYMCSRCFEEQKIELAKVSNESHFGTGKSKFYRESDLSSHEAVRNMPISNLPIDNTLYLSNSTFYNDCIDPYSDNNNTAAYNFSDGTNNTSPTLSNNPRSLDRKVENLENLLDAKFDFGYPHRHPITVPNNSPEKAREFIIETKIDDDYVSNKDNKKP